MKIHPKISKFLSFLTFNFFLLFFLVSPVFAGEEWDKTGDYVGVAGFADLEILLQKVLGGIFSFGLIVVFIMLLYGGFKYLTAGGNPEANQKASGVITYAVLGLALMIGSWFILRLIASFTGLGDQLLDFSIIFPNS